MRTNITPGTVIEVTDRGSSKSQYAVAVKQPRGSIAPNDDEVFVWVGYDNGCVVPVREYHVRALTPAEVVAKLNSAR